MSVLVMCHTRQLALRISKEYERFCKCMNNLMISVFFEGMLIKKDKELLKANWPHIIVGILG